MTLAHLTETCGDDAASWGRWLANNLFVDGRRRTIVRKLSDAGIALDEKLHALVPA